MTLLIPNSTVRYRRLLKLLSEYFLSYDVAVLLRDGGQTLVKLGTGCGSFNAHALVQQSIIPLSKIHRHSIRAASDTPSTCSWVLVL